MFVRWMGVVGIRRFGWGIKDGNTLKKVSWVLRDCEDGGGRLEKGKRFSLKVKNNFV